MVRGRAWVLGLGTGVLLAVTHACIGPSTFTCAADDDCAAGGTCEVLGYCSLPDPDCPSGRRYDGNAGSGLAGQCVDGDGPTTGSGGATGSTTSGDATSNGSGSTTSPPTTGSTTDDGSSGTTGVELGPWGPPEAVAELAAPGDHDDPELTDDLLEIVFNSDRNEIGGNASIWSAIRNGPVDSWEAPQQVAELDSPGTETNPVIARDGLTIWFTSLQSGSFDIYVSTRPDRNTAWSIPAPVAELNSAENETAGSVTADGLLMMISSDRAAPGNPDIYVTTRASPVGPWSPPTAVPELNSSSGDGQPWISADGTMVVFDSDRGGSIDLFMSERTTRVDPWQAPTPISELNTAGDESDAWLSPDLRTIYFVSGTAGTRGIYRATR